MLFNTMFPCVAFYSLYGANIHEAFDPALIGYSVLMAILLWSLTIPLVMKLEKDPAKRGAMIQAINRSNFLVIAFPIVENICGKENLAATALTIVGMLLVNNIFAVVVLEVFRGSRPKPLHMLERVLLNDHSGYRCGNLVYGDRNTISLCYRRRSPRSGALPAQSGPCRDGRVLNL